MALLRWRLSLPLQELQHTVTLIPRDIYCGYRRRPFQFHRTGSPVRPAERHPAGFAVLTGEMPDFRGFLSVGAEAHHGKAG